MMAYVTIIAVDTPMEVFRDFPRLGKVFEDRFEVQQFEDIFPAFQEWNNNRAVGHPRVSFGVTPVSHMHTMPLLFNAAAPGVVVEVDMMLKKSRAESATDCSVPMTECRMPATLTVTATAPPPPSQPPGTDPGTDPGMEPGMEPGPAAGTDPFLNMSEREIAQQKALLAYFTGESLPKACFKRPAPVVRPPQAWTFVPRDMWHLYPNASVVAFRENNGPPRPIPIAAPYKPKTYEELPPLQPEKRIMPTN